MHAVGQGKWRRGFLAKPAGPIYRNEQELPAGRARLDEVPAEVGGFTARVCGKERL